MKPIKGKLKAHIEQSVMNLNEGLIAQQENVEFPTANVSPILGGGRTQRQIIGEPRRDVSITRYRSPGDLFLMMGDLVHVTTRDGQGRVFYITRINVNNTMGELLEEDLEMNEIQAGVLKDEIKANLDLRDSQTTPFISSTKSEKEEEKQTKIEEEIPEEGLEDEEELNLSQELE